MMRTSTTSFLLALVAFGSRAQDLPVFEVVAGHNEGESADAGQEIAIDESAPFGPEGLNPDPVEDSPGSDPVEPEDGSPGFELGSDATHTRYTAVDGEPESATPSAGSTADAESDMDVSDEEAKYSPQDDDDTADADDVAAVLWASDADERLATAEADAADAASAGSDALGAMVRALAIDSQIVLTMGNAGFSKYMRTWIYHIRKAGVANYLVVALDAAAEAELKTMHANVFALHSEADPYASACR